MEDQHSPDDEEEAPDVENGSGCCKKCLTVTTKLYIAHAITTWGDRMWSFAVSLFLVKMSEGFDLQLTAIYGLMCSLIVIIFGAPVGRWIDNAPRLSATVKTIVCQNAFVIVCAAIIMSTMGDTTAGFLHQNQWIFRAVKAAVILFGALAYLASMGSSICISKDWVVVICQGDKERLAKINAKCRGIDLTTKICSPFLVGLIMSQMTDFAAAAFIASWNVFSMTLECLITRSIYHSVPLLAKIKSRKSFADPQLNKGNPLTDDAHEHETDSIHASSVSLFSKLKMQLMAYIELWASYFRHAIFPAGFGLACLYMTVLGFDGITIGYAYSQGVSEYVLGILGGAGAVVGIVGTIFYPIFRKKIGIERTGLIGFLAEVSCLVACVASIWSPGSPFRNREHFTSSNSTDGTYANDTSLDNSTNVTSGQSQSIDSNRDYTSVILLMAGIASARFGLWLIDLTINQIIQEEVEEQQRGTINGTQNALNMFMDLLKYALVILIPSPETFGFLIMASFAVICLGWGSYAVYSWRKRHHILPFHQYFKNCASINVSDFQPKDTGDKS